MTLHHLLTMEAGFNFDNDYDTQEMINDADNSVEYVLNLEMIFEPGTDWHYNDGNPQVISGIIQQVSGMTEEAFAKQYLFGPLDITNYQWEKHRDNTTLGAAGLWLIPRDMAKIGQMVLDEGKWEGEQIVSKEWLDLATQKLTTFQPYGYYWDIEEYIDGFAAIGHGGQYILIVPEKDLVIVTTADSYSANWIFLPDLGYRFLDIVEAIKE